MKGISKYNPEGYRDPTAYEALMKILREEKKAAKGEKKHAATENDPREENENGQKP